MGGKSSRFPGLRPKWMLTHPMTGNFMCIESIKGLNLDFFDKIYFIYLSEHEKNYQISKGLKLAIEKSGIEESVKQKINLVQIPESTLSQSETVYKAIMSCEIQGFIFVKDSDGYFQCLIEDESNQVVFMNLNNAGKIEAGSKSFIEIDCNKKVTNIVEKKVTSDKFCVGGYGFSSSSDFCKYFEKNESLPGECYVSNVIFSMLLDNYEFISTEAVNFEDWGTIESWNAYKSQFKTLFIDLDGTLVTNSSDLLPPYIGESKPLEKNISFLNGMRRNGKTRIIITTSRPENYREITESELARYGIPYDLLIMGLPHSQRVIINDFSPSNPFPSCLSLNLERNSDNLKNYLS